MRLVFRADASPDIGSGHAMRCFAIAEEAISRGIECILVGSLGDIRWLAERYSEIECPVVALNKFGGCKDGDILVLDSYEIENDDSFIIEYPWKFQVDIVDESTPVRNANLSIHPGLNGEWFTGDPSKFLFGSKFIPMRRTIKKNSRIDGHKQVRLVVFGGGTDAYGFARVMALELQNVSGFERAIFFSVDKDYIEGLDSRFAVLPFGSALDEELCRATVVFTTASTSSLEVLARELPVGIACSVANQLSYFHTLGKLGVAAQIGERVTTGDWQMQSGVIEKLVVDQNFQTELASESFNFIDMQGAKRIVDSLSSL